MLPEPYDLLPTSALRPQMVAAGDVLFRQSARTRGLYVLKTGRVHLERVGPNGERLIIHRATSGTSFAEASVFSEHYHCDAIVMDAAELVRIDKSAVLAAFANPDFARAYGRHAAQQVQAHRQIMGIVGIIWFGSFQLGGVIATAMIINLVIAGLAGIVIPVILEKVGVDPALASGAFVTTVTDVVGFFAFLGLAVLVLL